MDLSRIRPRLGSDEGRKAGMNVAVIFPLLSFSFLAQVASVGAQEAPFKGKTMRVIVGFPSGGGSDAEGRVLARHLGKYIPGNPTLIVQNMPGAGGLTASNCFEDLAKPDGSTHLQR